ncbi:unnamed protein product [Victoria cruziana]
MQALAKAGYRAIAPDFRGYGLSHVPPLPKEATQLDLIQDTIAILDSFGISKAFFVGKDFGAMPAYLLAILHPERVLGVISLGIPYILPYPQLSDFQVLPEGFYILRWQEPGRAESDFGRFSVKTVIRNIYILFSRSELPIANKDQEIMDLVSPSTPLPSWFSEDDLKVYSTLYENSGFQYPLEMPYRCMRAQNRAETGVLKVRVPTLLIMGGKDYVLKLPGWEDLVKGETMKEHVPDLDVVLLPEGSHFVQEQFPDEVNDLIIDFLNKHPEKGICEC